MATHTVTTYINNADPFSFVRIKCYHDEIQFVAVGEIEPTDAELNLMGLVQDVEGWTQSAL